MRYLDTFKALPAVLDWFPGDDPAFDLCLLDDATVVTADEGDLIAPIRRGLDLIERSDYLRVVGNGISQELGETIREAVEGGQSNTMISPRRWSTRYGTTPNFATTRAILESERATPLQYGGDEDLPVVQIGDDSVALCSGDPRAMIETDDPAVYEWAESYFASLRSQTTPVPAEAFAEEAASRDDGALVE